MKAVNEILKSVFLNCLGTLYDIKFCLRLPFFLIFLAFGAKGISQPIEFTSNGSFTVPQGVTTIIVECWGAGGAGGGNPSNADGGGGGGGGAYARSALIVIPGTSYDIAVGAGGIGSNGNGTSGGDTWFGTPALVLAKGGSFGSQVSSNLPGAGGSGGLSSESFGDVVFSGGNGGRGRDNSTGRGGPGGSSAGINANGTSGSDPYLTTTAGAAPEDGGMGGDGGAAGSNGGAGNVPGGGGGGSGDGNRIGGDGADGFVRITWPSKLITSSGNFTIPAGVDHITIEAWGGGGAGGAATGNPAAGGGGAGGAYAFKHLDVVPSSIHYVTIGAGGTGGAGAGPSGGGSSFSSTSTIFAQGGAGGGLASANSSNGAGGVASSTSSIGDFVFKGGNGATGVYSTTVGYGGSGGSGAGSTGIGNNAVGQTGGAYKPLNGGAGANGPVGSAVGSAGSPYGGGGSGGHAGNNTNRNGGSGANGCVIVSWETPVFYYNGSGNISTPGSWRTVKNYPAANFTDDYQTFIIESGSEAVTSGAGWTVSGIYTKVIVRGTLTETQGSPVSLSSNTMLVIDDGGILNHNNNSLSIFGGARVISGSSTVNYGMIGNQTVLDAGYGNLTLSGSGLKTINNTIVDGVLSMEGTASVSAPVTYGANATLQYKSNQPQTTGPEFSSPFNYSGGVIFDNSAGVSLSGNCTVGGSITMKQGNISTGAFALYLSNNSPSSLIRISGTIIGKFTRNVSEISADYLFPVGTTDYYRGATLNFSILSAATDITSTFDESLPGSLIPPYSDGAESLNNLFTEGFWRFNNTGIITGTYSASLTSNNFTSYYFDETSRISCRTNNNPTWRSNGSHGSISGAIITRTGLNIFNNTSFDFAIATCDQKVTEGGYAFVKTITIDHTKVAGSSDLFNFPVMISFSGQDFLKNTPAGRISNPNGWDIGFTDIDNNKLDYQIEYFNGTNGDLIAWVRIPILSRSSNTVIQMVYGDPAVITDPSVNTVWDSHYKGVWHFDNNGLADFSSYNKSATPYNSPTTSSGKINNALRLNRSLDQYAVVQNAPNINFTGNVTISAWVNMSSGGIDQKIAGNQNGSGGFKFGIYTNNKVEFEIRNSANIESLNRAVDGGTVLNTGQWYYLAGMSSDILDSIKTFVNGMPERPFKKDGTLGLSSNNLTIGKEPFASDLYFNGMFDELRISDKVRSDGWLRTEYYNQNSPSTFYTVGNETANETLPSIGECNAPLTLSFGFPTGGVYSISGVPLTGNIFDPGLQGPGTFTITYTAGCKNRSVSKNIVVTPRPVAPVAPNVSFCSNQIVYLRATGTNIEWYKDGVLVSTANPYSPEGLPLGTHIYTVTQSINGCKSNPTTVTLTISDYAIAIQPLDVTICEGDNATFTVASAGYGAVFQWYEGASLLAGETANTLVLTNPGLAKSGKIYTCTVTSTCGANETSSGALLKVTPIPVATFSYQYASYCINAENPSPVFIGTAKAGVFSSTNALDLDLDASSGTINLSNTVPGDYIVTNTIAASDGCDETVDTSPVSITASSNWIGGTTDWNNGNNWSCRIPPSGAIDVTIFSASTIPEIVTGGEGSVRNLTLNSGSALSVSGTLKVAGTITNSGTLNSTNGTIELNGNVIQTLGSVFAANTVKNLNVNNASGVVLSSPLNVTGVLYLQNGNLDSDGNLTLVSDASGTALISVAGSWNVTGDVTMQRYLPSGYGYKYFSSPFSDATVDQFNDEGLNTDYSSSFNFFKYNENNKVGITPVNPWINISKSTEILSPMRGYSINFGYSSAPKTVDVTGNVTNGERLINLQNNYHPYSQGFNLVGNPYPSPIDWELISRNNVDKAFYLYKSGTEDPYEGVYISVVDGIPSDGGDASNIIPSMQGFFVHVPEISGVNPVLGSLGFTNGARINNNFTQPFSKSKSLSYSERSLVRIASGFADYSSFYDPLVLYLNDKASFDFDGEYDALKFYNTDYNTPSFWSYGNDGSMLSINGIPRVESVLPPIPLGLSTLRDGEITFRLLALEGSMSSLPVYLYDASTGISHDLSADVNIYLEADDYVDRFFLGFRDITTESKSAINDITPPEIWSSGKNVYANINCINGNQGLLSILDLTGRIVFTQKILDNGRLEFSPGLKSGLYIVTLVTDKVRVTEKIFLR
ncbi:MAG TPA: DUF2341 domain-containing protein [Bacteroidales bacterium]|nr:DUF2341 domain-containing protein [Bacteroidales bacterium]